MRHLAIGLAALAASVLPVAAASAGAWLQEDQPSWLDQPLESWNQPAMSIPPAPPPTPLVNPRCLELARWAESQEDLALVQAGWNLYNSYTSGWGISVIYATSTFDGMCRPMGHQAFVFVDGEFAGTISPEPMDSRTTGDGAVLNLGNGLLSAEFRRYAPEDPACCPSRPAVLIQYQIERTPDGPVLTPINRTEETPPPSS